MPNVEFACEGRLLFRTESDEPSRPVPRMHEIVVINERPYQVVDVEYWVRQSGLGESREIWPTVYLVALDNDAWRQRIDRRKGRLNKERLPTRY